MNHPGDITVHGSPAHHITVSEYCDYCGLELINMPPEQARAIKQAHRQTCKPKPKPTH